MLDLDKILSIEQQCLDLVEFIVIKVDFKDIPRDFSRQDLIFHTLQFRSGNVIGIDGFSLADFKTVGCRCGTFIENRLQFGILNQRLAARDSGRGSCRKHNCSCQSRRSKTFE